MRVMIIVTSLNGGGVERAASKLASKLSEHHEVWVVCTWPQGNENGTYSISPDVKILNLDQPYPFRKQHGKVLTYLGKCRQRHQLISYWKRLYRIEVAISFHTQCNMDNVLGRGWDHPVISVRNIMQVPGSKHWFWKFMDSVQCIWAGALADEVICVSDSVAREQRRKFLVAPRKLHTVYNSVEAGAIWREAEKPVEHAAFRSLRARSGFMIITAGRYVEQKGHLHLLKVFRRLSERFPDLSLVILGEGMLRQEYESYLRKHGLQDRVLLPGFVKEPFRWFGEADLFVMPSIYEGFSNALLEAEACGLPIVAADCVSGARELLAPGTEITKHTDRVEYAEYGILTAPLSGFPERTNWERGEEALRAAISRMIRDRKLREFYRERSFQRCADFSPEKNYREWEEIVTKYEEGAKHAE